MWDKFVAWLKSLLSGAVLPDSSFDRQPASVPRAQWNPPTEDPVEALTFEDLSANHEAAVNDDEGMGALLRLLNVLAERAETDQGVIEILITDYGRERLALASDRINWEEIIPRYPDATLALITGRGTNWQFTTGSAAKIRRLVAQERAGRRILNVPLRNGMDDSGEQSRS